jgi:ribose transport system permease protein
VNSEVAVGARAEAAPSPLRAPGEPAGGPTAQGSSARAHDVVVLLERYALVILLVALIVFFSVLPATGGSFLTLANLRNVAANEAVIAIAALAAMVPLVAGQFDVSIGAVLGMVSIAVAALTVRASLPVAVALSLGVMLGGAVGAVSGFVVAYLRANSFIITLGVATMIAGLVSLYTKDQVILGVPQSMVNFGTLNWLGVPRPVWLLIVVALLVAYLLRYTVYGRHLLSIGSNPRAARLVGIRVPLVVLLSFVVAGVLAAVAGELELARTGSGDPQIGPGFTLSALAAAFLGSTTIRPGQFNVPGTIVGVLFVAVSVNGLTLAGAADWVDPLFNGTAVVVAVAISTVLAHRRSGIAPG